MSQPAAGTSVVQHGRLWVALGLTFLLIGVGFANPFPLVRSFPPGIWEGQISREALNLYALTAFLGWGHFLYAWHGQFRATRRLKASQRWIYWSVLAGITAALLAARHSLGVGLFSLLAWVYNIGHFIKAENLFSGARPKAAFQMPAIAFGWFTLVLFRVGPLRNGGLVFASTVAIALGTLALGDWKALTTGSSRMPLLTLFFLGECLVWSAYQPYMSSSFRVGIYVFHIAAASFFHYVSSYVFAQKGDATPPSLHLRAILGLNAAVVLLGYAADRVPAVGPLRFVLAPEWFTFWVVLHLASSDLLPWWRKRSPPRPGAVAMPAAST